MKKFIAILAMACILAVAGCGNTQNTSDTASTTAPEESDGSESGKKVTQVAYAAPEREDTTEDTLKYLEQNSPQYYNYVKLRRSVPLVCEVKVTKDGSVWETGVYIKDENNFVNYVKNPDGSETRVVYKDGKTYQVESAEKVVYTFEFSEDTIKEASENARMAKLYLDDYMSASFSNDTAEYNGKEYDRLSVVAASEEGEGSQTATEYYFDKTTGSLVYQIIGDTVTEMTRLESVTPDESWFEVPSDYEQKTSEDYYNKVLAEMAEAAQSQAAE